MPAADRRRDCFPVRVGSELLQDIPTISEPLSMPAADRRRDCFHLRVRLCSAPAGHSDRPLEELQAPASQARSTGHQSGGLLWTPHESTGPRRLHLRAAPRCQDQEIAILTAVAPDSGPPRPHVVIWPPWTGRPTQAGRILLGASSSPPQPTSADRSEHWRPSDRPEHADREAARSDCHPSDQLSVPQTSSLCRTANCFS